MAEARRYHLAALAREVEVRGLRWRLAGAEESVLRVVNPHTRRQAMVLASLVGDGWCYLWPGGGMGDARDPSYAADQIARLLA
ncbi:hypothetical protein DPM19_28105 [Actinomadura craniellae]|uniref:Uncharacterized protein n=1 Tax=Actinomadura craniellae TaxID=2231787 RepID=A0A365GYQ1_9ACTN|nr:hypothetical protein DPM19_28105 [Actinomadura craniellae]